MEERIRMEESRILGGVEPRGSQTPTKEKRPGRRDTSSRRGLGKELNRLGLLLDREPAFSQ